MAAGDVVSSLVTGNFQPAAGISIIILLVGVQNGVGYCGLTDGVTNKSNYNGVFTNPTKTPDVPMKLCITNSIYFYSSHVNSGFSGIQIK